MRAIRAVGVARLVCALSASAVAMTGCTSMHRPPAVAPVAPQPSSSRVGRGDVVRITMRDGRRVQFTVQTVDAVAIIAGDGTRHDLADILTFERREFSGVKTTLLIAGVFEGLLLVAGILVTAATH